MLADYGTFAALYGVFHVGLRATTVTAYIVGFLVSFCLNKLWVFQSRGGVVAASIRQFLLTAVLLCVNIAFTYYFVAGLRDHYGVDPRIGKVAAIAVTTGWNYVLYSRVVFAANRRRARAYGRLQDGGTPDEAAP